MSGDTFFESHGISPELLKALDATSVTKDSLGYYDRPQDLQKWSAIVVPAKNFSIARYIFKTYDTYIDIRYIYRGENKGHYLFLFSPVEGDAVPSYTRFSELVTQRDNLNSAISIISRSEMERYRSKYPTPTEHDAGCQITVWGPPQTVCTCKKQTENYRQALLDSARDNNLIVRYSLGSLERSIWEFENKRSNESDS